MNTISNKMAKGPK